MLLVRTQSTFDRSKKYIYFEHTIVLLFWLSNIYIKKILLKAKHQRHTNNSQKTQQQHIS